MVELLAAGIEFGGGLPWRQSSEEQKPCAFSRWSGFDGWNCVPGPAELGAGTENHCSYGDGSRGKQT